MKGSYKVNGYLTGSLCGRAAAGLLGSCKGSGCLTGSLSGGVAAGL